MATDDDAELPAALSAALEVVLRDLTATGWAPQRIHGESWTDDPGQPSTVIWGLDGAGLGISVMAHDTVAQRLASLADQVQEWAVEDLWGRGLSTSWPGCPEHPGSHPLETTVRHDRAVWVCPRSGTVVAEVGALR